GWRARYSGWLSPDGRIVSVQGRPGASSSSSADAVRTSSRSAGSSEPGPYVKLTVRAHVARLAASRLRYSASTVLGAGGDSYCVFAFC
ncbi:MAG: hypothetical protein LQ340_002550, partial [Diploschistes diacapsis]